MMKLIMAGMLVAATFLVLIPTSSAGSACNTRGTCCYWADPVGQPGSASYTATKPVSDADQQACYHLLVANPAAIPAWAVCIVTTPGPCPFPPL